MTRHTDTVEVILKDQRRRRWSPAEAGFGAPHL